VTKVVIGNGVKDIPSGFQSGEEYHGCFSGCTSLQDVVIGNSVAHIGSYSFAGCSNLTSIIIPASVTHISGHAILGTSVYGLLFMGEPPRLEMNSETSLPDNLILFYIEGTLGWIPLTWGGFSVDTWLPTPWIVEQPLDQSVAAGAEVTFKVNVNVWEPLYQWFKDGVAIEGARTASYTIQSAKVSDSGRYSLQITTESGSVTSREAILTVNKGTNRLWHRTERNGIERDNGYAGRVHVPAVDRYPTVRGNSHPWGDLFAAGRYQLWNGLLDRHSHRGKGDA
jgi:hypothetical protein